MTVALYRSGRAGIRPLGELLFPALVLAFGVVGWSHLYHAVVLGLLLAPAPGVHDRLAPRLAAAGQHHHIDAALASAGPHHEAGGVLSLLEHGGRHALVAQVVALPLALLVVGRRGRRCPARVRRVGWWPRGVALASASLLVLTGASSTGNAVAAAGTGTVH